MLDTGTAPLVIVLSALLINTRLIAYGAGLAPWFATLSRRRRLLLAAPLLDQLYLAVAPRFERGDLDERGRQAYYAGAAIVTVFGWSAAQLVGVFAGAAVPDTVGLEVAAPVTFAGLLARATVSRASLTVAVAALAVGAAAGGLPYRSGPLAAAAVGVGVGCVAFPPRRGEDR
jgi:predicted branched-subunit amino acid permease